MALDNANEYVFTTPTRRLLVRQAKDGLNTTLETVAEQQAGRLVSLLGAEKPTVSALGRTTGGADVVTVVAEMPGSRLQSAFLRFAEGPIVEMTLDSPAAEADAEAEFRRLLDSVRPAPADDTAPVARTLAAGPLGKDRHPVGPVLIDLAAEYRLGGPLILDAADGSASFQVDLVTRSLEAGTTRAAQGGTLLGSHSGARVGVATGRDGEPIGYEIGMRPRLRRSAAPAVASATPSVRGASTATDVVNGVLNGTRVEIRVTVRKANANANANDLAQTLLRELGGTPEN